MTFPASIPSLFPPPPLNSAKAFSCPLPDPLPPCEALKAIKASRGFDVVVVIGLPSDIYFGYIMKIVIHEIHSSCIHTFVFNIIIESKNNLQISLFTGQTGQKNEQVSSPSTSQHKG